MSEDEKKKRDRERKRQERSERPTISFVTDRQTKEDLLSMAKENGYSTIKAFMEALAQGYRATK